MPPVIAAAIAGIVVGLGTVGTIGIVGASLLGFATFALGTASSLLQQNKASFEQRGTALLRSDRVSITPGRLAWGTNRSGGAITFMTTTDDPDPAGQERNRFLHIVITIAYSPIDEFLTIFFNDYPIHLHTMVDSNGFVTVGKYKRSHVAGFPRVDQNTDLVRIQTDTGNTTGVGDLIDYQPFPDLQTETAEWTLSHKQLNRAKIYIRLKFHPQKFSGGIPNITCYYRGRPVKDIRDSVTAYSPNPSLITRDILQENRKLGGLAVDADSSSSVIEINETSFIAAANDADEEVAVNTTVSHPLRNFALLTGTNFTFLDEVISPSIFTYFPSFLDETMELGRKKRGIDINTGDKIEFSGIGSDMPSGLNVNTNYYIILKGIGQGLSGDELIDIGFGNLTTEETKQFYIVGFASTYLNAIRDIPVESATSNTNSTTDSFVTFKKIAEPRYQCSAIVELDRSPQDYLSDILSTMSARLVYVGGKFKLVSYEFFTPIISFNESDFRAPLKVKTKISRRDRFNIVKGLYTSTLNLGRPSNYPVSKRQIYIDNDNGEILPRNFNFPYTPSQTTAQRLARIELEKHRQEITVELPLRLTGLLTEAGDNIQLSFADMGWTNKVFEVMEWTFILDQASEGNPIAGVDILAKETASAIWDWDETVDESLIPDDLTDDTNLPDSSIIAKPTNLKVVKSLFTTSSGSFVQVRLTLTRTASVGPYLHRHLQSHPM